MRGLLSEEPGDQRPWLTANISIKAVEQGGEADSIQQLK